MIQRINFRGNVYYLGNSDLSSKDRPHERATLKRYADEQDCDIAVYKRESSIDGTGIYKTIVVKVDEFTKENMFAKTTYDFKNGKIKREPI